MSLKSDIDWMRSTHNLTPRKMDWEDKIVITGCVITIVVCLFIMLEGLV